MLSWVMLSCCRHNRPPQHAVGTTACLAYCLLLLHTWSIVSTAMDDFIKQYANTASFDDLVASGTSEGPNSGTLLEQMRKQALANQAEQDEEEDGQDADERAEQQADEWAAYAAMQEAEEAEDQEIHERLMHGSSSRPSNWTEHQEMEKAAMHGSSSPPSNWTEHQEMENAADDPEAEAKARALSLYRAAESAVREAAMQGTDEATRLAYLAAENQVATEQGIKWRDRGPRGEGQPKVFKGQRWRESSQRYSSRGGTRQAEFHALHAGAKTKGSSGSGGGKGRKEGSSGGGSGKAKEGNKGGQKGPKRATKEGSYGGGSGKGDGSKSKGGKGKSP
jgi:hypothetical protein